MNKNFIIGQITVVGNEPFTELGIMVDDTTVFVIDCSKEMKEALRKNQGQIYKLFIEENIESKSLNTVSVITAEKINK